MLEGPAWVRYAVELQLQDSTPDHSPVLQEEPVREVIERLKGSVSGLPALKTGRVHYTETGKAYWDLFLLADIGLSIDDAGLREEAEAVFHFQSPDGTFRIPPNVQENYFCMSAILLSSLAGMGYRDDPRLAAYVRAVMGQQMYNGGWDCYNDVLGSMESCPMDNLNILMLLGHYENYRHNPQLNGAIDLLLEHWEDRNHLYGFGVGKRFRNLQYPAVKYGILRVLDTLSLYPYATGKRAFRNMLDFVRHKADDGKYYAEAYDAVYGAFDFAQTEQPSRWITFLVNRIDRRVKAHS